MAGAVTTYGIISLADHLADPVTGERTTQHQRLNEIADAGLVAEQLGYASFGLGEHHFGRYIMPAPELVLANLAARTSRILLGTSVSLLANLDPLRFAEQLAVLDHLTEGRAEVTFARGASRSTIQAFGVDDFDQLRPRFDEGLRLVLRLLTETEVTWSGEYRAPLDEITIQPRPLQQPHPTIWVGGGLSEISASLAAEVGLPFLLPSLFRWPEDYAEIVGFYRKRFVQAHGDAAPQVGFPSYVHTARTSQQARAQWRPYLEQYQQFASSIRSSFGRPTDFDSLLAGPAVCGSPAEVVDKLGRTNELLGLDRHLLLMDAGGMPATMVAESMALTAEALGLDVAAE